MSHRSFSFKDLARAIAAIALLGYVGSGLSLGPAAADGGGGGTLSVRMRDNCDPATFTAGIPQIPNVCVGGGEVTFAEFVAALPDGGHHDWRFQPNSTEVKPGTALRITNQGGETHSFTEVSRFGTNALPPFAEFLNSSLPAGTPPAIPVDPAGVGATFVPSGGSLNVPALSLGVHRFQCFIHPWMRSTITVKN